MGPFLAVCPSTRHSGVKRTLHKGETCSTFSFLYFRAFSRRFYPKHLQRLIHSHTRSKSCRAIASSSGAVSCSGTTRHSRSRDPTSNLPVTSQSALHPEPSRTHVRSTLHNPCFSPVILKAWVSSSTFLNETSGRNQRRPQSMCGNVPLSLKTFSSGWTMEQRLLSTRVPSLAPLRSEVL